MMGNGLEGHPAMHKSPQVVAHVASQGASQLTLIMMKDIKKLDVCTALTPNSATSCPGFSAKLFKISIIMVIFPISVPIRNWKMKVANTWKM